MTKPTRLQEQACDRLVDALLLICEAARLDGKGRLGLAEFEEVARRVAQASSAFSLDEIVIRALDRRGKALGLRSGTSDLLTLMESEHTPLAMLTLPDDAFRELVAAMEQELGEV
ncbi:hypothetical protein [Singulisphaera sp. PoT]|uniref:hypothetical protein n=1 Tax=Singulisphaera sp. PoT TaxID=3411797 RepID=UPI003BF5F1C9